MTTPRASTVSYAIACLLLLGSLTGCATSGALIQARIDETPAVFAALTKQQQQDSKWGTGRPGLSPDIVYFAFGNPERILTTPDSDTYVWVYLDRTAINQEAALISAMNSAGKAGNAAAMDRNANFPLPPGLTQAQAFPE